ncbi:hypothetical protein GN244_ATG12535 [Phytophthora infestans]|uniref:Uncharacterized protein n=1 Tax=Phytophthora infestans TaxID=4787 RepID=A0A833WSK2_PHYIN|nr:hypothetical protein GN244_ATG12535 [Phytophthora infestans]
MESVQLPRQSPSSLTTKKIKSLSLKYFTIPEEYRAYYPDIREQEEAGTRSPASHYQKESWAPTQAAASYSQESIDPHLLFAGERSDSNSFSKCEYIVRRPLLLQLWF